MGELSIEEGKPMPKALQIELAKKLLQKHGIDPQTVDLEAEIDETLRFDENMKNLSKKLGVPLTKKLEEIQREKYSDEFIEQKYDELVREWLIMEIGEDEYYEILEEIEEREDVKREKAKQFREEIDQMLKESMEREYLERQQRLTQLVEYWEQLKQQGVLFEYLANLIAPHLEGEQYIPVRKAVLLVLASHTDIGHHRCRLHLLLHGKPGCGKTEVIRWIYDYLAPHGIKAEFVDAVRMSKVGLTVDARGKEPKPGVLVKANKGLALIDELDKAKLEDLNGLLSAMESGKFKITVGGVDEWFDAEVRVIATANEINKFPEQLVDRFDFVYELKPPTLDERKQSVDKLVDQFFGDMDIGRPAYELAQYLSYIAGFRPKCSAETREKIKQILKAYMDLRKSANITSKSYRNFELSIFRITYAYAKIHRRDIQAEDVIEALRIKDPELNTNETVLATLYAIAKGLLKDFKVNTP